MRVLGLTLLSSCILTSCATLVNGTDETFHIATIPEGATVRTTLGGGNSAYACDATPCAFNVSRKATFVATVEKPGYHPVRVVVRNSEFKRIAMNDAQSGTNEGVPTAEQPMLDDIGAAGAAIGGTTAAQLAVIHVEPITSLVTGSAPLTYAVTQGLIVAAPISIATDSFTGSLNNLYPNPVAIRLIPDDQPISELQAVRRIDGDTSLFTLGAITNPTKSD